MVIRCILGALLPLMVSHCLSSRGGSFARSFNWSACGSALSWAIRRRFSGRLVGRETHTPIHSPAPSMLVD